MCVYVFCFYLCFFSYFCLLLPLFLLPQTSYPELEETHAELRLLEKLYDLYVDVIVVCVVCFGPCKNGTRHSSTSSIVASQVFLNLSCLLAVSGTNGTKRLPVSTRTTLSSSAWCARASESLSTPPRVQQHHRVCIPCRSQKSDSACLRRGGM